MKPGSSLAKLSENCAAQRQALDSEYLFVPQEISSHVISMMSSWNDHTSHCQFTHSYPNVVLNYLCYLSHGQATVVSWRVPNSNGKQHSIVSRFLCCPDIWCIFHKMCSAGYSWHTCSHDISKCTFKHAMKSNQVCLSLTCFYVKRILPLFINSS